MSFVKDGPNLPGGKSDYKALSVPANKAFVAAEWNARDAAINDLRSQFVDGTDAVALLAASSPALSAALKTKMAMVDGRLKISTSGDIFRSIYDGEVYPEDYGAKGDGTTDDGPALQACINAAATLKKTMRLTGKTYMTGQELRIASPYHAHIRGTPLVNGTQSVVKAMPASGIRSVMFIGITACIEDVVFDGNSTAFHARYLANATFCRFDGVADQNSLSDGCMMASELDTSHFGSNGLTIAQARGVRGNAITLRTSDYTRITGATCSVTSGNVAITFAGVNLNTLGLLYVGDANRPPSIIVRSGGQTYLGRVLSIDSNTQLTVRVGGYDTAPTFSAAGAEFLIYNYANSINDANSTRNPGGGSTGALWATSASFANYTTGIPRRTDVGVAASNGVTVNSGNATVTFATFDPLTNLVRPGDVLFVGAGGTLQRLVVATVDTNKVTVLNPPDFTSAAAEWCLPRGDGYRELQAADNNINVFEGTGLYRGCAGFAFAFGGFYGPSISNAQIDYCGAGAIRVGYTTCYSARLDRNYTESCGPTGWAAQLLFVNCVAVQCMGTLGPTGDNRDFQAINSSGFFVGNDGFYEIGVFRNRLRATKLDNPTLAGAIVETPVTVNVSTALSSSKPLDGNRIILDPGGADRTLTGAPAFTAPGPGLYTLQAKLSGDARITLNDEYTQGGSKLHLQTPQAILQQGDTITFFFDGTLWWETSRTTHVLFSYSDSSGTPGAATSKSPRGKATIASGATFVRITTPYLSQQAPFGGEGELQVPIITFLADPGQRWWVERAYGYFDVKLSAAAGANITFAWRIPQNG